MRKSICIYILCVFIFSADYDFILNEGDIVESHTMIIKFNKLFSPLLGLEVPISIDDIPTIPHHDNLKELTPLFTHIENFTELHYAYELHQYYKLTVFNHDDSFFQIISDLKRFDMIDNVELNGVAEALLVPNDELYPNQWDHDNQGQGIQYGTGDLVGTIDCDLDTDIAWDITTGNSEVVIAIIDTGVDLDHPDLIDNIIPGYNFIDEDLPPDDEFDHGTPCAGIAAATMNNDIGIAGVCPECSLMSVKVFLYVKK